MTTSDKKSSLPSSSLTQRTPVLFLIVASILVGSPFVSSAQQAGLTEEEQEQADRRDGDSPSRLAVWSRFVDSPVFRNPMDPKVR
jgi:hypothetical protein